MRYFRADFARILASWVQLYLIGYYRTTVNQLFRPPHSLRGTFFFSAFKRGLVETGGDGGGLG